MKKAICSFTNKKTLIIAAVLTILLYCAMVFVTIPRIQMNADGMKIFDMSQGYNLDYAAKLISKMPQETVDFYRFVQIPIDMLYPAVLGLFCFMSFCYLEKRVKILKLFYALPILIMLFDYLENIMVFIMLSNGVSQNIVFASSIFTIAKSAATTITFITLIIVFVVYIIRSRKEKISRLISKNNGKV